MLTSAMVMTMAKVIFCKTHPDIDPIVVRYCPACRGGHGGTKAAAGMTGKARKARARKAAAARWKKTGGKQ
jgi:hypothetical protein